MKLTKRAQGDDASGEVATDPAEAVDERPGAKNRPTPKRRDSQGKRGPVSAPRTRKEAYARQKQQAREQRTAKADAKPRTVAEQRAALRRGDEDSLPRRDRGKTRRLARDYVDSTRMLSNYLLWLFPLMIISAFVPGLAVVQLVVLVVFVALLVEWYFVGRRIRAMALSRFGDAQGGNMTIGFYAGSRAYLPRRWRLPAPRVERGEEF